MMTARPVDFGEAARALRRTTHRTIAAVSEALDSFAFNVAVARLYELANASADAERRDDTGGLGWARREAGNHACQSLRGESARRHDCLCHVTETLA